MAKKTTRKANGAYAPPLYKAYLFRDKDPSIDQLRTLAEDSFREKINSKNLREIEKGGGPKVGTMRQWFFGKTKRPTNATLEAAGRAIGWERKWSKMK
jgi:hypothetical protein